MTAPVPRPSTSASRPVTAKGLVDVLVWLALASSPLMWLGAVHPVVELVCHHRMTLAAVLALGGLVWLGQRRRRQALLVLSAAIALGWPALASLGHGPSHKPGNGVVVLQLNVHTQNRNKAAVVALLEQTPAQLVALEEVDAAWLQALAPLHHKFPYRLEEPRGDNFGIALWSQLPLQATQVTWPGDTGVPSLQARIDLDGAPLHVVATHPLPPTPAFGHDLRDRQLQAIAAELGAQPQPVLLVGDLNATPWSPIFQQLVTTAQLEATEQQFWPSGTWPSVLPAGRIWIDHILPGHGARLLSRRVLDDVGSDHLPVLGTVGLDVPVRAARPAN